MEKIKSSVLQALIITKNEEPNIQRVLEKLTWLESVVVLDSYSTDSTIEILRAFPNVVVEYRAFDSFASQCNYGLSLLHSSWALSLDADYVLTDGFIDELRQIITEDDKSITAYNTRFKFLIYGKELLGNNTTPRPVLFRREKCKYIDDGHAHRLVIHGDIALFKNCILHDDRKSLSIWLSNQDRYSIKEGLKLKDAKNARSLINKIRRTKVLAPIFVFFYCLFYKRLIFNGWIGWYYTIQRTMVEMIFALRLIEDEKFNKESINKF